MRGRRCARPGGWRRVGVVGAWGRLSGVLCVCLRVWVGGGWLGACMWHARGEQRRRAADGSVALRAAAAAWAARVVAHPPLRRIIRNNDALASLPAGLFGAGFQAQSGRYDFTNNGLRTLPPTLFDPLASPPDSEFPPKLYGNPFVCELPPICDGPTADCDSSTRCTPCPRPPGVSRARTRCTRRIQNDARNRVCTSNTRLSHSHRKQQTPQLCMHRSIYVITDTTWYCSTRTVWP